MREPSMLVREAAAEQLEERQSDWAYLQPRHSRSLSATLQPRHSRSLLQTSSFFSFDSLPLLNSAADFGVDGGEVPFWCRLRSVEGAASAGSDYKFIDGWNLYYNSLPPITKVLHVSVD
ncbi:unnamed protein product [Arabidopsis lyrata]|nr:unnamed protein product [Arabidopsis lyrata]